MQAKDVMSRPVFTVRLDDTVEEAAALLTSRDITSAPVVDSSGDLVGMVSEVDVIPHTLPGSQQAPPARSATVVADVMTRNVAVVPPETDLRDVAKALLDYEVRCLPVIDETGLLGVVSRRDVLRSLVRTDTVVQTEIQTRLDDYAGGDRRWVAAVTAGRAVVTGQFDDDAQEKIVGLLARTVPGVVEAEVRRLAG